jgi:hypothetical protein
VAGQVLAHQGAVVPARRGGGAGPRQPGSAHRLRLQLRIPPFRRPGRGPGIAPRGGR